MREEVSKKFGEDFLLQHEVNQLESGIMEIIKCRTKFTLFVCLQYLKKKQKIFIYAYVSKFLAEALSTYLPKDTTPARAWTLAKVSLRSLKRDLRRKQGSYLFIFEYSMLL